ncbi:MAG TPA: hypothetical protein DCY71_01550 [Clostridiaceae bacterium]|nr:hypothetical protein [Clostridiaceae bacterium]
MRCPYCNQEMDKGFIHNPKHVVSWYPEGSKVSFWSYYDPDYDTEAIRLTSSGSVWEVSVATAHICKRCKKVIIDYDKDYDEYY